MLPSYVLFSFWIASCYGTRGPHHPRGGVVVKHHVHYKPTRGVTEEKLTQDEGLLHDTAHLQEHLEEVINEPPDLSKLSDEELEFYYFQLHDTDNNSKLDGLEILQAILHTTHSDNREEMSEVEEAEDTNEIYRVNTVDDDFEYYIELIDRVLQEDDKDRDGYLNYPEFVAGGRKTNIQTSVKIVK